MNLNGKIALVTGANRGIGREITKGLRDLGAIVVMGCRDVTKGEKTRCELGEKNLEVVSCDTASDESVALCRAEMESRFGILHILINNAGIFPEAGLPVLDQSMESIRATLETNLLGPLRMCREFVPLIKRAGGGRIINMSSELGQLGPKNSGRHIGYRMSKTGLNMLTRALAAELERDHIHVNAVCPGWVKTDMGGPEAPRPLEGSADTILWLAAQDEDGLTGGLFMDRKAIPW